MKHEHVEYECDRCGDLIENGHGWHFDGDRICADCGHSTPWSTLVEAKNRPETDPCQAGTVGCCVDHTRCDHECATW